MKQISKEELINSISAFALPKYNEIPNVGLYLEQASKYVSEFSVVLQGGAVTGSMISNYVKQGLLSNPVKKQYDRDQIAYLIFISIAKMVLSMELLLLQLLTILIITLNLRVPGVKLRWLKRLVVLMKLCMTGL